MYTMHSCTTSAYVSDAGMVLTLRRICRLSSQDPECLAYLQPLVLGNDIGQTLKLLPDDSVVCTGFAGRLGLEVAHQHKGAWDSV